MIPYTFFLSQYILNIFFNTSYMIYLKTVFILFTAVQQIVISLVQIISFALRFAMIMSGDTIFIVLSWLRTSLFSIISKLSIQKFLKTIYTNGSYYVTLIYPNLKFIRPLSIYNYLVQTVVAHVGTLLQMQWRNVIFTVCSRIEISFQKSKPNLK